MGDVHRPIHPRSTNKLVQASAMRELGLRLEGEQLALSAASHWGEPFHVSGVRAILKSVGVDESVLQNSASLPEDPQEKRRVMVAGTAAQAVFHGCSGKHAAMVATCRVNDWPVDSYLEPAHPLQRALRRQFEEFTGESVAHEAVDGCGAPAWAISLTALARSYRRAVLESPQSASGAVAAAMRAHPEYVGGTESEVTGLMRAVPGLLVKDGAEAVYAAALPDGRALALKIADGGFRAAQPLLVAALRALGAGEVPGVDGSALDRFGSIPVLGHGAAVGAVRPLGFG